MGLRVDPLPIGSITMNRIETKYISLEHCVSPKSAHVHNHPFGGKRCWQRCWVEKTKRGKRFCVQTTKKFIIVEQGQVWAEDDILMLYSPYDHYWNKTKKGVYYLDILMFLNFEDGHVKYRGLSKYDGSDKLKKFTDFRNSCEKG